MGIDQLGFQSVQLGYLKILQMGNTDPNNTKAEKRIRGQASIRMITNITANHKHACINRGNHLSVISRPVSHHSSVIFRHNQSVGHHSDDSVVPFRHDTSVCRSQRGSISGSQSINGSIYLTRALQLQPKQSASSLFTTNTAGTSWELNPEAHTYRRKLYSTVARTYELTASSGSFSNVDSSHLTAGYADMVQMSKRVTNSTANDVAPTNQNDIVEIIQLKQISHFAFSARLNEEVTRVSQHFGVLTIDSADVTVSFWIVLYDCFCWLLLLILRREKRESAADRLLLISSMDLGESAGEVEEAYRLLPPEFSSLHNVFHVSMLRKYELDPSHVLRTDEVELDRTLSYVEYPLQILDRKEKQLRNKTIPLVMVQWSKHGREEATWELEREDAA
ncbi:hypothetical protein F511_07474 [Dorcoceras hygrometricum]|uniref:Chromo domain-containing protein n=1 Tax=Dorcoceras hygrometricum TaxID=472368 RepID=A0A2Z7AKQ2_9LAMI|nr:hypothetical protein F511_07474 [Dorcoceras hygrometricum]